MPPKDEETLNLRKELEELIKKIQEEQKKVADTNFDDVCANVGDTAKVRLVTKKMLKGHINKVNSVHYSGDSRHIVTGSLDGKLIIWDTWTGNKVQVIPLRSSWVMSVAFSQSGNYVACGGMDNMCTVYDVNNRDANGVAKMTRELLGYEGFLSSCRFSDDKTVITGSGDMKICVWDVEVGKKKEECLGHAGDVVSMSLSPDGATMVTGSVDKTCKLWDIKSGLACRQVFFGHEADVNSVSMHPSGFSFCSGSEDKTARLFDIRSDQVVSVMRLPTTTPGFTSCGVSLSGRFLLCGADDNNVHIFDILKAQHNGTLQGHENRITSLSVAPSGIGVSTCSWDQYVRVWG